jgi:hypothetical protein
MDSRGKVVDGRVVCMQVSGSSRFAVEDGIMRLL